VKAFDLVPALYVSAVLTVAAALTAACRSEDPQWLNRGGSFVAALAALAVYFQIQREIRLEAERERMETSARAQSAAAEHSTPLEQAAQRLEVQRRERHGTALTAERVRIGLAVAVCAFVGECLHGFGDVALEAVIRRLGM
jgi:hypothetical protein